jgi:predicted nucleic acid-binding protein
MMVLVDTSVWIRFFGGREPYLGEMVRILDADEVAAHDLVYGELLVGDRGGRRKFLESYGRRPRAGMVPHEEVVSLARTRELLGKGVGWMDVHLLASAAASGARLWTADAPLHAAAVRLGVEHRLHP